jgi:LuxR family maltose regulon positive regulatory protein
MTPQTPDVQATSSQRRSPSAPPGLLDPWKLTLPPIREGSIDRARALDQLRGLGYGVAALVAPPGYGKTTLLTKWAHDGDRTCAWVTLDERDDDPAILLSDLAFAIDRIHAIEPALMWRLTRSTTFAPATLIGSLAASLASWGRPFALVLDDMHVVQQLTALDVIAAFAERLPPNGVMAFAARERPELPLGRLRSEGRLLELGPTDLAMDTTEAKNLLRSAGLEFPDEAVNILRERTEGWPAGLSLAALSIRGHADPIVAARTFLGGDRFISDYVRGEMMARIPRDQHLFLVRTSVLNALTPSLCDAVVKAKGSGLILDQLERSIGFLVPMGADREWYRYHQLFREVLLSELQRNEPELVPELHRRAAVWLEANDYPEDAIEHLLMAEELLEAARIVCSIARPYVATGRLRTIERWMAAFDDETVSAYPPLAVAKGWIAALRGEEGAVRWLQVAETSEFEDRMPDGTATLESAVVILRALMCKDGVEGMIRDASRARELEGPRSLWRVAVLDLLGEALLLAGRTREAEDALQEAVDIAGPTQASGAALALAQLAAIAAGQADWDRARTRVERAQALLDEAGVGDFGIQILTRAMSAMLWQRRGEPVRAREELTRAHRLRAESSSAIPWLGIRARIVMARVHAALSDVAGARTVLLEAREIQRRRPDIGVLAVQLDEVEGLVAALQADVSVGATSLTASELRVLTLLPSHLSFREIGERFSVSQNTVKSQVMAIYRKLSVGSRSEAVARAQELGLLDA